MDATHEDGPGSAPDVSAMVAVRRLDPLRLFEDGRVDDCRVFAGEGPALVIELAEIDPVGQDRAKWPIRQGHAALDGSALDLSLAGDEALGAQGFNQRRNGSQLDVPPEQHPHLLGLGLVDEQLAVLNSIAEWHRAAHPEALLLRCGDLVADPLARHFAFKLGKGEQHIEGQATHAVGGIEGLRHGYERDPVGVEQVDQPGKVGQRASEAIDLVDDDDVDQPGGDICQQGLEGGSLQTAAGEAAVVIEGWYKRPAFMRLAFDIGFTSLTLVVE